LHFCSSSIILALKGPTTESYFLKNLSIAGRGIFSFKKRVVGQFGLRNAVLEQWFSTLNARRPTKDKNKRFGGPPLSL